MFFSRVLFLLLFSSRHKVSVRKKKGIKTSKIRPNEWEEKKSFKANYDRVTGKNTKRRCQNVGIVVAESSSQVKNINGIYLTANCAFLPVGLITVGLLKLCAATRILDARNNVKGRIREKVQFGILKLQ